MPSLSSVLLLAHLIGLGLGLGSATAKLALLLRSKADPAFLLGYLAATRPITRLIILGLVLLTVSGVGWLLAGYPLRPLLIAKLVLVGALWALGPVIDVVVEPQFKRLAPQSGETATPAFIQIQGRYVLLETIATGLFYVIVVLWVLR
jgi:hypothetical protein